MPPSRRIVVEYSTCDFRVSGVGGVGGGDLLSLLVAVEHVLHAGVETIDLVCLTAPPDPTLSAQSHGKERSIRRRTATVD